MRVDSTWRIMSHIPEHNLHKASVSRILRYRDTRDDDTKFANIKELKCAPPTLAIHRAFPHSIRVSHSEQFSTERRRQRHTKVERSRHTKAQGNGIQRRTSTAQTKTCLLMLTSHVHVCSVTANAEIRYAGFIVF